MLLLLVSCGVDERKLAIKFAKDFCSCYGGLDSIHFAEDNFNFVCSDRISYGKDVIYDSVYYGEVCEKK